MFCQLFLEFLCENGLLTKEQVQDVSERRKTAKAHIGTLALSSKLMTAKQVDDVVKLQSTMDKRFGEIAIMKGYITPEELSSILNIQPKEHIFLSQVLTGWGILDFDTIIEQTLRLQAAYGLDDAQMEKLIDGDVTTYVDLIARVEAPGGLFREFAILFLKMIIRLVERDLLVRTAFETKRLEYGCMAYQPIIGEQAFCACFIPDEKALVAFAERYTHEKIESVNDLARDAIKEFLNCVNGLFVSEMSNRNIAELDIDVPIFKENGAIESETPFYALPFRLPLGEFTILAADASALL